MTNDKKNLRKWILVVDDDEEMRELISESLYTQLNEELKIIEARDGVEASAKLNAQAFDCILTDLNMPNRDGQQFIDWVKRSPLNESTPIIVVTGFPDPLVEEKYKEVVTLEKPFLPEKLGEAVKQQLSLGRLDKRVGAEVLNTLVQVCNEFIKQVVHGTPAVIKPQAKKPNEPLKGDVICCMKIKTKESICRLGLGFDNKLIENMYKAVDLNTKYEKEELVDVALKVIFKITSRLFHHNTGVYPTLDERIVFTETANPVYEQIIAAKGVIIPIESELGCLWAHAIYVNPKSQGAKSSSVKKGA